MTVRFRGTIRQMNSVPQVARKWRGKCLFITAGKWTSTHQFSISLSCSRGWGIDLELIPAITGQQWATRTSLQLNTVPTQRDIQAHLETIQSCQCTYINLHVFGCWGEAEHPQRTHAGSGRTCRHAERPELELNPEPSCCEVTVPTTAASNRIFFLKKEPLYYKDKINLNLFLILALMHVFMYYIWDLSIYFHLTG